MLKRAVEREVISSPADATYVFPRNLPLDPPAENRRRRSGYWALFANPDVYRIEDAIAERPLDYWVTTGKPLQVGDRCVIWKGKGKTKNRGIIALAEVVEPPQITDDGNNPYWMPTEKARKRARPQERVGVRYYRHPDLPIWMPDPLLKELPVGDAQGGTVFYVEEPLWSALLTRLGGWPGDQTIINVEAAVRPRGAGRKGQGFARDAERKKIVEDHAVKVAQAYYEAAGWNVENVGDTESFDLLCRRKNEELHVEVKGTTGDGSSIFLTSNEVAHAQRQNPRTALFIVRQIVIRPDGAASSDEWHEINPWVPDVARLVPKSFQYYV